MDLSPIAPSQGIADLTYRRYAGPLFAHTRPWWVFARSSMGLVRRKPGFWVLFAIGLLPYIFSILFCYLFSQRPGAAGPPFNPLRADSPYGAQHFQALRSQGIFLFGIAMMAGSGSVSADLRANALVIYLARPLTRWHYVIGKWLGTFLIVLFAAAVPALVLFFYFWGSYAKHGFLHDEPTYILRLLAVTCAAAAVHASLTLACSAWSKSPRMAGAAYAALYFGSAAVAGLLSAAVKDRPRLAEIIGHASISGLISGMGHSLYHAGSPMPRPVGGPAPHLQPLLLMAAAAIVVGLVATRVRIRAVEVIRG